MKQFYQSFQNCQTLSSKLSWSHYTLLMRLDDEQARDFYIKEAEAENWSVRELDRQIGSLLFERLALSRNKVEIKALAEQGQILESPRDAIKDPYILEFLGLPEQAAYSEKDLETALLNNLQSFLLELGKGFTFIARQKRITLDAEHFYIDLAFYNRLLRCFVLIDLKIGKLTHRDLGQMQMYVNFYDREVKTDDETPTIGITLCRDKKETIARYTLPEDNTQIFASKYKLYLPTEDELIREVDEVAKRLEDGGLEEDRGIYRITTLRPTLNDLPEPCNRNLIRRNHTLRGYLIRQLRDRACNRRKHRILLLKRIKAGTSPTAAVRTASPWVSRNKSPFLDERAGIDSSNGIDERMDNGLLTVYE